MPEQNAEQSSIFSKREVSTGRIVLVFGAEWEGPRPGVVISSSGPHIGPEGEYRKVVVHTWLDTTQPHEAAIMRASSNTFEIPLCEALTDEQRSHMGERGIGYWAEWPDLTKPLGAFSERRNPANPTLTDAPR
ncbi:MAG: hypothetical protein ACK5WB_00175 [Phycisphaerales bacterium]|jgi:hypothetical protein|nr:hypothetical protein [Phycisphaeraceae bacterium]MTA11629.1 hypothetical protein [Actinomycetota bacterium]